jgi:hypothetical protein
MTGQDHRFGLETMEDDPRKEKPPVMRKLPATIQRPSERTATKLLKLSTCHEVQKLSYMGYVYSTMTNLGHKCDIASVSLKFLKLNVINVKLDKFPLSRLEKLNTNSSNTG